MIGLVYFGKDGRRVVLYILQSLRYERLLISVEMVEGNPMDLGPRVLSLRRQSRWTVENLACA